VVFFIYRKKGILVRNNLIKIINTVENLKKNLKIYREIFQLNFM
jgi:hypothetical protein